MIFLQINFKFLVNLSFFQTQNPIKLFFPHFNDFCKGKSQTLPISHPRNGDVGDANVDGQV